MAENATFLAKLGLDSVITGALDSLFLHCTGGSYKGFTILNTMYIASESLKILARRLSKHRCFERMQTLDFYIACNGLFQNL